MTRALLHLGEGLSLPYDAVTQTFAILAVRGAGKTNTASVMAEEMFEASLPFVVIDPVGSWWGLRSKTNGTSVGLALPIFGGRHGDIPLDRGSGEALADFITDRRPSCVIDISDFESEAAKKQFLLAFAVRLYKKNTQPIHLFLEEADDYIPQRPMRDEAQLLRAWENIVRRGRARGLGITLITQRSAVLNKNVLTQIETLFVMRTTSPQDRKAVEEWVKYHGQSAELLESLSSLDNGEAWCWSPHWLGRMVRAQVRRRWTFDSGATPKHYRGSRPPATLADIDLPTLTQELAAARERAKADDPRELRKRILELEKQVGGTAVKEPIITKDQQKLVASLAKEAKRFASARIALTTKVLEVERLTQEMGRDIQGQIQGIGRKVDGLLKAAGALDDRDLKKQADDLVRDVTRSPQLNGVKTSAPAARPPPVIRESKKTSLDDGEDEGPTKCAVAILRVCKQRHPKTTSVSQAAVLTGYRPSGSFMAAIADLRKRGLLSGTHKVMEITADGLREAGEVPDLPRGSALLNHWVESLSACEGAILRTLFEYESGLETESLAEKTNYKMSGSFMAALAKMRKIELIQKGSPIRIHPTFLE